MFIIFAFTDLEEDGGFGVHGEKTRYATLQKNRETLGYNGAVAASNSVASQRGYETMRQLRSIPSLVNI